MAKPMTSSDLIKSLKRRGLIPTDQSTFDNDDFLEILNEELQLSLLPLLLSMKEEHLVNYKEIPNDTEAPIRYQVPYRSVGNKLRDVSYIDASGNPYEMSRISLEEISDYSNFYSLNSYGVFYMENDNVVIPSANSEVSSKIRMYFYLRPSDLVLEEEVGVINGITKNATETTISIATFPDKFSNNPAFDIVGGKSPNKIRGFDIEASSVNKLTKSIVLKNEDVPEDIEVGDYLCQAEETPVPQIPTEMHPLLAQMAVVYILESLGDTEGLANASRRLEMMKKNVTNLIDNRVEGAPQKIKPRHTTLTSRYTRFNNKNIRGV